MSTDPLTEALALLQEAADYLDRLPTVPATRHLSTRLRQHLAEPTAKQAMEAAQVTLRGLGPFTAVGIPLMEVSISGDAVNVGLPSTLHGASRGYALKNLMKLLGGLPRIELKLRS